MTDIIYKLSENERQILDTLWIKDTSLTRSEIINLTEDKTWKESSIHILLNQLLDKKAIKVDDIVRTGKSYGRTYSPTLTKEEYDIMQLNNFFKEVNPSELALKNFFSNLIESENIEDEYLDQLEDLIRKHKKD